MEFEMTAVFHYGKDSEQYIRRFQEKRLDYAKIIIQVLAIIAEFERDILNERIQNNLMELAKDGR